jgi:transposase
MTFFLQASDGMELYGTHSWFNRFRKLLVRYEKLVESYEALVCLAAAIICWRKVMPIYG